MNITSSLEIKRPVALKKLLQEASTALPPDALILILTQSKEEANKVSNFIQGCRELSLTLNLSNIHYGPITSPPVNNLFSLVIYYAMPKKIEQLFSQMSLLLNNFLYKNYGKKISKLNVIHFHLLNDPEEYTRNRLQAFMKAVSELQLQRMLAVIKEHFTPSPEESTRGVARVKLSDICKGSGLSAQGVSRVIKQCQGDSQIELIQMVPCTLRLKLGTKGVEDPRIKSLQSRAGKQQDNFLISTEDAMAVLDCTKETDLHQVLKSMQAEELLFFEIEDEMLTLNILKALLNEETGLMKSLYKKLLGENMTECKLLQFIYLILRIGSTSTDLIFNKKLWNKNMVSLLKNYALAEESSIKNLFPENAVKDILEDVKATDIEIEDASYFYAQLLGAGTNYFPQELELCKEEQGSAAREFMRIQLLKTLLDLPGCLRPEQPIHSQFNPVAFRKIDFESLLHIADHALANHSRTEAEIC